MEHRILERGIGRVTVPLPIAIGQIELDAAADWLARIDGNRRVTKIGPGFAVPRAELDNVDLVSGRVDELFSKITSKPTGLKFQFARHPQREKEGTLADPRGPAHLGITSCRFR